MTLKMKKTAGIIPCAGMGSRLGRLPFSKELYPIGQKKEGGKTVPKVVCDYLIDQMTEAGISDIHFVLRKGKWDIPGYYGGGLSGGFNACYHIADYGYGVPFSVNQVFPFIKDRTVVFGFPDILFRPENAYQRLLERLDDNDEPAIVLGVMPVSKPEKWDMVELDNEQNVKRLVIKSAHGKQLSYGWTIAAWNPGFSEFLNKRISQLLTEKTSMEFEEDEIHFGHIVMDAVDMGFTVKGVIFDNGRCLDIGTPEDLSASTLFLNRDNITDQ